MNNLSEPTCTYSIRPPSIDADIHLGMETLRSMIELLRFLTIKREEARYKSQLLSCCLR